MAQILCSTGALIGKANNWDYTILAPMSEKLNCDGYEFMMYRAWHDSYSEIIDFINSSGINIPVMHCEKRIGDTISNGEDLESAYEKFEINCSIARAIGAEKTVLHLWNGFASDACFENNLKALERLFKISKGFPMELLIENVVCNHFDPMTHWIEIEALYPEAKFIYDTKMAAFHCQDTLIYSDEYSRFHQKIRHFHINDYAGGYMDWGNLKTLPIGAGHVDFDAFFKFIKKIGYDETFTVEATAFNKAGEIDTELLNSAFERIREYLK